MGKKLITSIVLFIIGIFMVLPMFEFGDSCQGMAEAIFFIFFLFVYLIVFGVILIVNIIRVIAKKVKFNYYPVITTVLVIIMIFFVFKKWQFESPVTLKAESIKQNDYLLILHKNNKFEVKMLHADAACFYRGKYSIKNDTLILFRDDIVDKTDSLFFEKYYIDSVNNKLVPIIDTKDTLLYLDILFVKK